MSLSKFDPKKYLGKKTIEIKIPNQPGIYSLWDWSKRTNRYVKRQSGNKFCAYKKVLGKQKCKFFGSCNEAINWRSGRLPERSEEETDLYFISVKEKFLERHKHKVRLSTFETLETKMKHLKFFDGFLMSEINPKTVDAWLEYVKSPKYLKTQNSSRFTYRHELSALRQVLSYYAEYICDQNSYAVPVKRRHQQDCIVDRQKYEMARAKKSQKFLPPQVLEAFLAEMKTLAAAKESKTVFYLLALFQARTGARIGECCALDWRDIDLSGGSAYIHRNVSWSRKKGRKTFISPLTKTGESRLIYFPKMVCRELEKWKLLSGRNSGLVFSLDGFSPVEYRSVQHMYDKALKVSGSEWRGTHIMRHSFATDFLEKTGDAKALQGQLGHQTSEQTDHYAKITSQLKQRGMNSYEESLENAENVINIDRLGRGSVRS